MKKLFVLFVFMLGLHQASALDLNSPYAILNRLTAAPGNITVTMDGRIIISLHQFYAPPYSVAEVSQDGSLKPFPNAELNARPASGQSLWLDSVLGIRADSRGIVWMLDNGLRSKTVPKLVGWDTQQNKLHQLIELPAPIAPADAFVNDLAIDEKRKAIYITDPAGGANAALIVVDMSNKTARRVLQGHASLVPEDIDLMIDAYPIAIKDPAGKIIHPHIGANPITIDKHAEWLYFGAMHGRSLYRIKAGDLYNAALSPTELASRIERYAAKPISDGIAIDSHDNIYLGDLAANAIGIIAPDRTYHRLAENNEELAWVDSFSTGPRQMLYAVVNRLHQSAMLNAGNAISKPPYFILSVNTQWTGKAGG